MSAPENHVAESHVVLARKYRPRTFSNLIGQETLVKTLQNAIRHQKLAHAFILTGVRGVGKTTTARILAKAVNCTGEGSLEKAEPCDQCSSCLAISSGHHLDVQEMDAASRTGVGDIRELIDSVHYKPTSGRYKIYILDEVHMLSNNAFNALLKTLEEPPEHVIFIFATTEIHKVPATILSRCQRFDLARVEFRMLVDHFRRILGLENVDYDQEAVDLIARAADGSVRDGLSLLDQAMVLSGKHVELDQVEKMLGVADVVTMVDLCDALLDRDIKRALTLVEGLYHKGCDPLRTLQDLLSLVTDLAKLATAPDLFSVVGISSVKRDFFEKAKGNSDFRSVSRLWQILEKGYRDIKEVDHKKEALEMVLMRVVYALNLPFPDEIGQDILHKIAFAGENISDAQSEALKKKALMLPKN